MVRDVLIGVIPYGCAVAENAKAKKQRGERMSEFFTTHELAALLRVKERKVYDLVAKEMLPFRRVTGKLLFPRDEIAQWLRVNGVATMHVFAEPAAIVRGAKTAGRRRWA